MPPSVQVTGPLLAWWAAVSRWSLAPALSSFAAWWSQPHRLVVAPGDWTGSRRRDGDRLNDAVTEPAAGIGSLAVQEQSS